MYIAIVLNWNSPKETIECVQSILDHCEDIDAVVIVDNASDDNSVTLFKEFASNTNFEIVVLENKVNSGYAGGNNFGLSYCISNFSNLLGIWIVNNDCFVKDDAFKKLKREMESKGNVYCGSLVVQSRSGLVECLGGGKFYPLIGRSKLLAKNLKVQDVKHLRVEPDYIMGCSLLVPLKMVKQVGLMDEQYFMYSEELDWQIRASKFGYNSSVVSDSTVYHHGSMSTGAKSISYYYYRNRASMLLNRKFFSKGVLILSFFLIVISSIAQEFKAPTKLYYSVLGSIHGLFGRTGKYEF